MTYLLLIMAVVAGHLIGRFLGARGRGLKLLLAFSGAFLLGAIAFELLPKVFEEETRRPGIFLLLGILLQILLEYLSGGLEHGHSHHQGNKFPWLIYLSLCIHAFLEGFPLHGLDSLTLGVVVHKIPIAIVLTSLFIRVELSLSKSSLLLLLFASMTPLGAWLVGNSEALLPLIAPVRALVTGILLHVSTTLILESSDNHRFNLAKFSVIIAGGVLAYFL